MRLPAASYAFLCLRTGKILFKRRPSSKSTPVQHGVQTEEMLMLLYAIFLHTNESSWASSMSDYRCGDLHHVFVKHTYFEILGIFTVTCSSAVEKVQNWNRPFDNALIRFVGEFDDILNDSTKRRNASLATFAGFKKTIELIARDHCTELLAELGSFVTLFWSGDDYCTAAFKLERVDGKERCVQKLVTSRGIRMEKDVTQAMGSWLEEVRVADTSDDDSLRLPCNYEKMTFKPNDEEGKQSERTMILGCIPFITASKDVRSRGSNRVVPEKRRDASPDNQTLHFFSVRVGQVMVVTATTVMVKKGGIVMSPANDMGQSDIGPELNIFRLAHQIAPCIS